MLEFKKDDKVKLIDPESNLIPLLKADGWDCGDKGKSGDDEEKRLALLQEAKDLGLKPHHKLKADKLKELIATELKE